MSKKFLPILAASLLIVSSCSLKDDTPVDSTPVPVSVRVNDFAVTQEEFPGTKATQSVADYEKIKAVTLAFYASDGTTKRYCSTQIKEDGTTYDTFGTFSLELPAGEYTMIVLAYNSTIPVVFNSMTAVIFGEEKSHETLCHTQNVTVTKDSPLDISATLSRISTCLDIRSTANRPEEVSFLRISLSKGGQGFNPTTGKATADEGFSVSNQPSSNVNAATHSSVHFFIASEDETMDVTIETLDNDRETIRSKTVTGVPFRSNRVTVLTGPLYAFGSPSGSFNVESGLDSDCNITF